MTSPHDWDLLTAEWHATTASVSATSADRLVLDDVAGAGALTLAPAPAGPSSSAARFRLRHRHPTATAPDPRSAPYLLVVRVRAEEPDRSDFRRWLDEEHCLLQVSLPGVHWYLGYEEDGERHSFLNLWSIDEPQIVDGGEWARVRDTPWWARVAHLLKRADRGVYRPRR